MLTPKEIRALTPKSKRYQITDSPGLALRVQVSGVKSWVFRFSRNGRVTDQTIGHWPEISLLQARAIVRKKQRELEIEPTGSFTVRDAF
ncbi:Arm DNA-binding domain-containing protein, partial [Parasutterella excrementihominis]